MTWLLTGGAGYIGAHVLAELRAQSIPVVVLDDLSTGIRSRVPAEIPFAAVSVLDADAVTDVLRTHEVTGVIHLAAKKSVAESVANPAGYYRENVVGFERLLAATAAAGVERMVYSSSAAVYGIPAGERVDERSATRPESPYGRTKLICEWMLDDVGRTGGMRHVSLRYFNVAGAASPALGDRGVDNLIPRVLRAISVGTRPEIFGGDYPTRDGTCVRDYVHVVDLARAHVAAVLRSADPAAPTGEIFNVGRGEGVTVREVMTTVAEVTGSDLTPVVRERRAGDPPTVVGDIERISAELGWRAELGLVDMVRSAWAAWPTADRSD